MQVDEGNLRASVVGLIFDYWRSYQIVTIGFFGFYLFANLPAHESFVYLIGKSKIEEAAEVFKRIGRFNRISKDQLDFKLKSPTFSLNVKSKVTPLSMFKYGKEINLMTS